MEQEFSVNAAERYGIGCAIILNHFHHDLYKIPSGGKYWSKANRVDFSK